MTNEECKRAAQEIDEAVRRRAACLGSIPKETQLLDVARFLLEKNICELSNSNDGVPQWLFNNGESKPWCASFVAYCHDVIGWPLPGERHLLPSCTYMLEQLKDNIVQRPQSGDLVFFYGRAGSDFSTTSGVHHVAIVEYVYTGDLHTIDGNFDNRITEWTRPLDATNIAAFARP